MSERMSAQLKELIQPLPHHNPLNLLALETGCSTRVVSLTSSSMLLRLLKDIHKLKAFEIVERGNFIALYDVLAN